MDQGNGNGKDKAEYDEEDWEELESQFLPQVDARREAKKNRVGVRVIHTLLIFFLELYVHVISPL